MEFRAEISFGNFYELDRYYCPRHLHAGRDYWVELDPAKGYENKSELVSLIYSEKTALPGHEFRHDVANEFGDTIDQFGTGADRYIEHKETGLDDYMFHVVIENAKYPGYVQEFFEPIKTMSVPIYWGGEESVRKLGFDTDGIIFFDTIDELAKILDNLSAELYSNMRPSVEYNRKRLIELRNQIKYEHFLDVVRPGFLNTKPDNPVGTHFRLE
jgi:hypothetical protein